MALFGTAVPDSGDCPQTSAARAASLSKDSRMSTGRKLGRFFKWYNEGRPHQSLGYQTPDEVYYDRALAPAG